MKPTVYVETSVISYFTARPSSDPIVFGHQEATRTWWTRRDEFKLVISPAVIDEIGAGDSSAAERRLNAVDGLTILAEKDAIRDRASALQSGLALPESAFADALHIAYCVEYEIEFLATWNCRHIANSSVVRRLESYVRRQGLFLPAIVTPDYFWSRSDDL